MHRLITTGVRTLTTIAIARLMLYAVILLAVCHHAAALDPSLDLTQYVHTAWMARDGLRGSVRSIVQTPDGYLWMGTEFGLVRFDGVRFTPWSPPPGQRLPGTEILSLLASRDGTLVDRDPGGPRKLERRQDNPITPKLREGYMPSWRITKGRCGLGPPAGSALSRVGRLSAKASTVAGARAFIIFMATGEVP